jgi:2-(1,2-epoxy-1,2-dihydrophenyl)acetyl-CoA isomerase
VDTGSFRGFDARIETSGVALITFNQPDRLNGMTSDMKRDLLEIITQAQMDNDVRVLVFTGSGRAFSAGDDISGKPRDGAGATALTPRIGRGHDSPIGTFEGLRVISQPLNSAVRKLDKLTIAAINGVAIQTGMSLALACDFRIASAEARLGSATLRYALLPDEGGQYLLVQHLGVARAMDFLMRSRIVDAEEALAMGLVHEVVPPEKLMDSALALARELAAGPQVAMRLLKRSIYNAAEMTFAQALEDIASKTAVSDHHPDALEGMKAFQEKRAPRFE